MSRPTLLLPAGIAVWVVTGLLAGAAGAGAQQILLDDSVSGGGMTLYRDLRDEAAYYYVPNRPRLARDEQGRPAFSFLRWVENVRSAGEGPELGEGEGGGILHLQMELDVSEERLRQARRDLRRLKPAAQLKGPVGFRSGRVALVFTGEGKTELTSEVLGVGGAPLLGGRVSVNVMLTRQGAKVLWQAFQRQSRPPLAVRFFDMEVAGFRGPLGVTIEADLEEVYKHRSFAAGVGHTYFGAEIEGAFDDLRHQGAIREVWYGEDERFEAMVDQTYRALVMRLFEPVPDPAALRERFAGAGRSSAGGGSILDRALGLLEAGRRGAREGKPETPSSPAPAPSSRSPAPASASAPRAALAKAAAAEKEAKDLSARAAALEEKAASGRRQVKAAQKALAEAKPGGPASGNPASGNPASGNPASGNPASGNPASGNPASGGRNTGGAGSRSGRAGVPSSKPEVTQAQIDAARKKIASLESEAKGLRQKAEAKRREAVRLRKASSGGSAPAPGSRGPTASPPEASRDSGANPGPAFAVLASFRMRQRSQQKTMKIELDRHRQDQVFDRFDGDIGDVSGCRRCFLEVHTDDPFYRQREIPVFLDGLHLEDFGRFVNFATVQLRKRHADGELTYDEVRIDRRNFAEEGNLFKLLYGWKGDNDRRRWLEYDYRVVWSFFGGSRIEEPWRTTQDAALGISPPLLRRRLGLAANAEALEAARVRAVTVQVFYAPAGAERVEQLTLLPERGELAGALEVLLPRDRREVDYRIDWRLRGDRAVSSGRRTTSSTTLFLDELPAGAGR